ncbi:MAG: aminopeptidase P N-terminal domain-containing protein [Alphaproteobacteria bacterium]|nr:aminopeptidase P N-terminal domain-containing protein [Alphaproteobacteria bacterium]
MLSPAVHAARRDELMQRLGAPVLLMGAGNRLRNLPMNLLPFRQDSSFLYFTGCELPEAAALITPEGTTLFLPPPAEDDALWHGHVDTLEDLRQRYGVQAVQPPEALQARCAAAKPQHALAIADPARNALAAALTGLTLRYGEANGSEALAEAIIDMRRAKRPEELAEHRRAAQATERAFRATMAATRPGESEAGLAALFDGALAAQGLTTGYHSIVTVRGEILHNPHYKNPLREGELLLLDGGGELPSGYGVDVTRTWPVSGRYTPRQRAAYAAVLEAQAASIDMVRPGVRYRDVHLRSAEVLARWLLDEGLLKGSLDAVMERHAAALFFPHGVGHLLGMDVHDLENFGDRAAYAPGRARSEHFGTAYLRMDLDLEPGHLVTIEPGFYVVPAILEDAALRARFADLVDWERAAGWAGFGGIRIEDDVLCTQGDPEVLTGSIPKEIDAVEALVGSGPTPSERFGLTAAK